LTSFGDKETLFANRQTIIKAAAYKEVQKLYTIRLRAREQVKRKR
jgi:hypothetical protein